MLSRSGRVRSRAAPRRTAPPRPRPSRRRSERAGRTAAAAARRRGRGARARRAVEPQEVEREAHADRVDRAAGHDQQRVVGRQRVEPREPAAARAAIGGDEQDEVAGQRAALEPRQRRAGHQRWFAVVGERRTRAASRSRLVRPGRALDRRQLRGPRFSVGEARTPFVEHLRRFCNTFAVSARPAGVHASLLRARYRRQASRTGLSMVGVSPGTETSARRTRCPALHESLPRNPPSPGLRLRVEPGLPLQAPRLLHGVHRRHPPPAAHGRSRCGASAGLRSACSSASSPGCCTSRRSRWRRCRSSKRSCRAASCCWP